MQPTIGRIVNYTLSQDDANEINRKRSGRGLRERVKPEALGNFAEAGQAFPAIVVRVWPSPGKTQCNLQVLLDGADGAWVTSRIEGTERGTWAWPPRS